MSSKAIINQDIISSRPGAFSKMNSSAAFGSKNKFQKSAGQFDSLIKDNNTKKESPHTKRVDKEGAEKRSAVKQKTEDNKSKRAAKENNHKPNDVKPNEVKTTNTTKAQQSKSAKSQVANEHSTKKQKASKPGELTKASAEIDQESLEMIDIDIDIEIDQLMQGLDDEAEIKLSETQFPETQLLDAKSSETRLIEEIDLRDTDEVADKDIQDTNINGTVSQQERIQTEGLIKGAPQEEIDDAIELDDPLIDEEDELLVAFDDDNEEERDDSSSEEDVVAVHVQNPEFDKQPANRQDADNQSFKVQTQGAESDKSGGKLVDLYVAKEANSQEIELLPELKEFAQKFSKEAVSKNVQAQQNNSGIHGKVTNQSSDAKSPMEVVMSSSSNMVLAEVSSKVPTTEAQRLFSNIDQRLTKTDVETPISVEDVEMEEGLTGRLGELTSGSRNLDDSSFGKNQGKKELIELASFGGEVISHESDEQMVVSFKGQLNKDSGMRANKSDQIKLSVEQAVKSGKSEVKVNLHPKALGAVDVTIEYAQSSSGEKVIQKITIESEQRQTLEMFERTKEELVKSLTTVEEMNEEASLEFNLKREDKGQGSLQYSDAEEREQWMNKFEQSEDGSEQGAGQEAEVDGYANGEGYIGVDGVNIKI